MRKLLTTLPILMLFCTNGIGQIDASKYFQVRVPDSIKNPIVAIFHSMGNINVKGHQSEQLVVYAEEMLPSVSELAQHNASKIYHYFDSKTKLPVTVNSNHNFTIQQIGNLYRVESNLYSLNSNVFVMTPKRASVSVHSKDLGTIMIEDIEGDVEAEGNAGNIVLKNVDGAISASTVHGNIITNIEHQKELHPVFISTFIGNIEIIMSETAKNTVLLSSEMGYLYSNFDTMNKINISATSNSRKNRKMRFDLNGGGTEFVINTFKGDIYLRHHE